MAKTFEPTPEQQRFMLTGEQKLKMAALAKALEECREAGIQFFTTDGENALMAYNTAEYDVGPESGDNLGGEWTEVTDEHGNKRHVFVRTPDEKREEWDEIPQQVCDRILGEPMGIDFISWGCCCEGMFAHRRRLREVTEPEELDFYSIEPDGKGGKQIHVLGYCYKGEDDGKGEWRNVEYTGFIVPLQEFVEHLKADGCYIDNHASELTQYIGDHTDEGMTDIINHYFCGRTANRRLGHREITMETPCGDYVC